MEEKTQSWFEKNKKLAVTLIIIGGVIVVVAIGMSAHNSDLNATVGENLQGLTISNNESVDWSGCEVGINGSCGFNFDQPPYVTHKGQGYLIPAGSSTTIPYEAISSEDGAVFDPHTHTVNSVVVMCSMGTNDHIMRSFCGTHK